MYTYLGKDLSRLGVSSFKGVHGRSDDDPAQHLNHGSEECLFVFKMFVYRSLRNVCGISNLIHACRGKSVFKKLVPGRVDDGCKFSPT